MIDPSTHPYYPIVRRGNEAWLKPEQMTAKERAYVAAGIRKAAVDSLSLADQIERAPEPAKVFQLRAGR